MLRPESGARSGRVRQGLPADADAPDCALPLYWPARADPVFRRAPGSIASRGTCTTIRSVEDPDAGDEGATGAVPHRTYDQPYAPWAPPGSYTVRLTVDGKAYTQPLTLRLDPRVKTPAAGLAQLASLTREMYDAAVAAHAAYDEARALVARLEASETSALKAQVDSLAPAETVRSPASGVRPASRRRRASPDAREREHRAHGGGDGNAGRRRRADGGSGRDSREGAHRRPGGDGEVGGTQGEGRVVGSVGGGS